MNLINCLPTSFNLNQFDLEDVDDVESFNMKYGINPTSYENSVVHSFPKNNFFNLLELENQNLLVVEKKYICTKKLIKRNLYSNNINESYNNKLITIEKDENSINLIKKKITPQFSLRNYLRRIVNKMFNKSEIKKVNYILINLIKIIIKFIDKERIDLENMILYKQLKSNSKKEELIECLVGVIFNLMKRQN